MTFFAEVTGTSNVLNHARCFEALIQAAECIIRHGYQKAMNEFN